MSEQNWLEFVNSIPSYHIRSKIGNYCNGDFEKLGIQIKKKYPVQCPIFEEKIYTPGAYTTSTEIFTKLKPAHAKTFALEELLEKNIKNDAFYMHDVAKPFVVELSENGQLDRIKSLIEPIKIGIVYCEKLGLFQRHSFPDFLIKKLINSAASEVICECDFKIDLQINDGNLEYSESKSCEKHCKAWRKYQDTALHAAIKKNYLSVVYYLLRNGADPTLQTADCNVWKNKNLRRNGSKKNIKNAKYMDAFQLAKSMRRWACVSMLNRVRNFWKQADYFSAESKNGIKYRESEFTNSPTDFKAMIAGLDVAADKLDFTRDRKPNDDYKMFKKTKK